jgi:hypothetical protein
MLNIYNGNSQEVGMLVAFGLLLSVRSQPYSIYKSQYRTGYQVAGQQLTE